MGVEGVASTLLCLRNKNNTCITNMEELSD